MNMKGVFAVARLMDFLIRKNKETEQELYPVLLRIFLYIAENHQRGATFSQIQNDLGIVSTSVHRAVATLADGVSRKPNSGMGLVESQKNPDDYRSKILRLTPQGQSFLNEMTSALYGPSSSGGKESLR